MFWMIAIPLGLVASAFVLAPVLFNRSRPYRDERADINLSLYRERLNECWLTLPKALNFQRAPGVTNA